MKLNYDEPLSNFDLNFNLRRYIMASHRGSENNESGRNNRVRGGSGEEGDGGGEGEGDDWIKEIDCKVAEPKPQRQGPEWQDIPYRYPG